MTSLQALFITEESERLAVILPRSSGHTKAWMQHQHPVRMPATAGANDPYFQDVQLHLQEPGQTKSVALLWRR